MVVLPVRVGAHKRASWIARLRLRAPDARGEKAAFSKIAAEPQGLHQVRLISAKNLYPKHRFFALFRRAIGK